MGPGSTAGRETAGALIHLRQRHKAQDGRCQFPSRPLFLLSFCKKIL